MNRSTGGGRSTLRPRPVSPARRRAVWSGTSALAALALSLGVPAVAAPSGPANSVPTAPVAATPVPTTPSDAEVEAEPVLLELTALGPIDAAAAPIVTFEGMLTNRSDRPLTVLNAYLRLSRVPVLDRADLARIADPGFRPGARQGVFVLAADALAPGASVPFRLDVAAGDLGLSEPGVYAAGVEVLATDADGSRGVVGRAMTALPWLPSGTSTPAVGVAVAWPVTAPVDRAADGTYLTDDLGTAMAPGGRLAALLGTAPDAPITWLVDPAVVEAAADLAGGYDVRRDLADPASARPGTRDEAAEAWLEEVRRLAGTGHVTLAPYADVDAVALGRAGLGADAVTALDAATEAAETLGLDGAGEPRDLLRPPGGLVDLPTAERLSAAGVTTLLLDAVGVRIGAAAAAARLDVGSAPLTAVLADDLLRGVFASTPAAAGTSSGLEPPTASRVEAELGARQLLLSHTLLAAMFAPTEPGPGGQTVLVVSGDETSTISPAAVLAALDQDVPWMQPVPLDAAIASPMVDGELVYPDAAVAGELPAAYLTQVISLQQKVGLRAALRSPAAPSGAGEPADLDPAGLEPTTAARLRSVSAAWRAEPAPAAAMVAEAAATIDAELGRIQIIDGGGITLSSQTGRFPITVVNDLAEPVTVQLALSSRTPARLRVPPTTAIEVPAGARTTVDVPAEANANGQYVVDAQLATATGARFGPASTLTIRATDYDTVAWIVMGVAGGLLVIGSARRLTGRVRAARRPADVPAAAQAVEP